ncbi:unnamed protein product, partial [Scytosiphon promiscuus]
ATFNPFGALDSDDEGDTVVTTTTTTVVSKGAKVNSKKSTPAPTPVVQKTFPNSGRGARKDGRGGGRGEGRGGRGGRGGGRFGEGGGGGDRGPERESFDDRRRERGPGGYSGYDRDTRENRDNRGGRSGYAGRDGRNREYDRRSGTGRGREMKKSGGGGRNWGNDAAAGMDNAAATAALDAEGGAGWAANGNAAEDPEATEVVDGEAAEGAESPKDDTPAPPAREPEPEEIQLTLDEHQAMLDAKAKELADMIGEVSIKTVDDSEFAEGAIRNKQEVQEEGYMGGKVAKTRKVKTQRTREVFQDVGFRAPSMNSNHLANYHSPNRNSHKKTKTRANDLCISRGGGGGENAEGGSPKEDAGPPRPRFQGGGGGRGGFRGEGRGY